MQRQIQSKLDHWKNSTRRKPLILQGARQVGKTFAIKEFGKRAFQQTIYLNFEEDSSLADLFQGKISVSKIISQIELYLNVKIDKESLIVFDEIQLCEKALTSLKYFSESDEQYYLIAAGSLLGIKLNHTQAFPVGKVNFLHLYPMDFIEFLHAIGEHKLARTLMKSEDVIEQGPVHNKLLELLKYYYLIGGMPEAVFSYSKNKDLAEVRVIHHEILKAYELDFAKYSNSVNSLKVSAIWQSLPQQLSRENKKFKLADVKSSARYREYEVALRWLLDAGLVLQSRWVSATKTPLESYADNSIFKLYYLDVGLLSTGLNLHFNTVLQDQQLFQEAKGALVENFVAQELTTYYQDSLYYWTNENRAEVDFLYQENGQIIPIEVKSGNSSHKKSLIFYKEKYKPKVIVRISPQPYIQQQDFFNIPLYSCVGVRKILSHRIL